MKPDLTIDGIEARAYRIPTETPEQDGTFTWTATTLVVVHVSAGGMRGLGYSYGSRAMVPLIRDELAPSLLQLDAMATESVWRTMIDAVRNIGRPGIASTAISAVDSALWDLKGRVLGLSLAALIGRVHDRVPVYGSGGFTNYSDAQLEAQFSKWLISGITRLKMKVGARPDEDVARVRHARRIAGEDAELMVDANGAWRPNEAVAMAAAFGHAGVTWFEEPVSSDDLAGLRWVRERAPVGVAVAAGEYGYDPFYFRHMLECGAVDVLQADATRCLGITGFLAAGRLCDAFHVPLSSHTASSLHAGVACCVRPMRHVEYFHDHARIESLLFDGFREPVDGYLSPDPSRPGLGVDLRTADAEPFALAV